MCPVECWNTRNYVVLVPEIDSLVWRRRQQFFLEAEIFYPWSPEYTTFKSFDPVSYLSLPSEEELKEILGINTQFKLWRDIQQWYACLQLTFILAIGPNYALNPTEEARILTDKNRLSFPFIFSAVTPGSCLWFNHLFTGYTYLPNG